MHIRCRKCKTWYKKLLNTTCTPHSISPVPIIRWSCHTQTDYTLPLKQTVRFGSGSGYLFGLTNAVPCFQRIVDDIIRANNCEGTYAYLDNITVGGSNQQEHDINLAKFLLLLKAIT